MSAEDFKATEAAVNLSIDHIISKGCDDIFKPPVFLDSLEHKIIMGSHIFILPNAGQGKNERAELNYLPNDAAFRSAIYI